MKLFKRLIVAVAFCALVAMPSMAQFRFGLKAGIAINDLKFDKDIVESSNRNGFTAGLATEFTVPVVGLGFDASVLYANRSVEFVNSDGTQHKDNRHYIDIPVNLKWKIGIPGVSKIICPFITTGPDFSFLVSKKNVENAWNNKSFDTAWTVGFGLQLLEKVQVHATYGWGLTKTATGEDAGGTLYSSKNRCWTITAAYYF